MEGREKGREKREGLGRDERRGGRERGKGGEKVNKRKWMKERGEKRREEKSGRG